MSRSPTVDRNSSHRAQARRLLWPVTVGVVFALVLPWALHREGSGGLALALAISGTLFAPGFWTGFPPGLAAGGALLGWAGYATKARRLSQVAFVLGVLGVLSNVVSYADVFI